MVQVLGVKHLSLLKKTLISFTVLAIGFHFSLSIFNDGHRIQGEVNEVLFIFTAQVPR